MKLTKRSSLFPTPAVFLFMAGWIFALLPSARVSAAPVPNTPMQRAIGERIESLGASAGIWGVYVEDLESKKVIVNINGDRLLMPASNRKLFSTALALRRLGPDYVFTTRFWGVGDLTSEGRLEGDLVLQCSGDPTMRPDFMKGRSGLSLLSEWSRAARAAGIQSVSGRVVLDGSLFFNAAPVPPGWAWDQLTELYAPIPSALALNENRVVVTISPGERAGSLCQISTSPDIGAALGLDNRAFTASASARKTLRVERAPGAASFLLAGDYPLGLAPEALTLPLPDPMSAWGELLRAALAREGIRAEGGVEVAWRRTAPEQAGPRARLLAEHSSPPLSAIVRQINKESDNHCAEMVYLAAGVPGTGQASYAASQAAEGAFLRSIGVSVDLVSCEDGCGLGRTNTVAPMAIVQLLRGMSRGQGAEAFRDSLPVAGRDGTLRGRMAKTADGRVRAKTGTLRDVIGLSGYVDRPDGRTLVFSILTNHFTQRAASIRSQQDKVCEALLDLGM